MCNQNVIKSELQFCYVVQNIEKLERYFKNKSLPTLYKSDSLMSSTSKSTAINIAQYITEALVITELSLT